MENELGREEKEEKVKNIACLVLTIGFGLFMYMSGLVCKSREYCVNIMAVSCWLR